MEKKSYFLFLHTQDMQLQCLIHQISPSKCKIPTYKYCQKSIIIHNLYSLYHNQYFYSFILTLFPGTPSDCANSEGLEDPQELGATPKFEPRTYVEDTFHKKGSYGKARKYSFYVVYTLQKCSKEPEKKVAFQRQASTGLKPSIL